MSNQRETAAEALKGALSTPICAILTPIRAILTPLCAILMPTRAILTPGSAFYAAVTTSSVTAPLAPIMAGGSWYNQIERKLLPPSHPPAEEALANPPWDNLRENHRIGL